eukprot:Gb_07276 [translate_table: standard]
MSNITESTLEVNKDMVDEPYKPKSLEQNAKKEDIERGEVDESEDMDKAEKDDKALTMTKVVENSNTTEVNRAHGDKLKDGEGKEEVIREKEVDKSEDKDKQEKVDRVAESLEMSYLNINGQEKVDMPQKIMESSKFSDEPGFSENGIKTVFLTLSFAVTA